jgi:hypothetical protein
MDRNILLDTMKYHPLDLKNYPEAQDDNELVLIAVKKNGLALEFASERLRNDYDIVLCAVKKNGLALEFASDELKHNEQIVHEAICSDGNALKFVPDELKTNRDLIYDASFNCNVELIPEIFLNDREIAERLIDNDYEAFGFLSDELRCDLDFIIQVTKIDSALFMYVPDEILSSKDIVLTLIDEDTGVFQFADDMLKHDKDVALRAVSAKGSPYAYEELDKGLKYEADIIRAFVYNLDWASDGDVFCDVFDTRYVPKELLMDDKFVSTVATIYGECSLICPTFGKEFLLRLLDLGVYPFDELYCDDEDDPEIKSAWSNFIGDSE